MASLEIDCVVRENETIRNVGGRNPDGTRWRVSEQDVIRHIESGDLRFYVSENGARAWVVVGTSAAGRKYLKTEADGEPPRNLPGLPDCPN